eukprot:Skav217620  [mRNA]  locus=scaffold2172:588017:597864:+ [translate_table: standard]
MSVQIAPFASWPLMICLPFVVHVAASTDACEPEQMSVLQEEKNAWGELEKKNKEDAKKRIETRTNAAKAANTALTKVLPAVKACMSAAAGQCDGVAIYTGISNGLAELGPLINSFTKLGQYVPMLGQLSAIVGQLLGLLVGSTGQAPAPISHDDMRKIISEELYTFELHREGWRLQGMLESVNHMLRDYGVPAARSLVFLLNSALRDSLAQNPATSADFPTKCAEACRARRCLGIHLAKELPKQRANNKAIFDKVLTQNVESCTYQNYKKGQAEVDKCSQEGNKAAENWDTLNRALMHWKAVAEVMMRLSDIMEATVKQAGCSCDEDEGVIAKVIGECKTHCFTLSEWRRRFQIVRQRRETVTKNLATLQGPSCAAKPGAWALAQTSASCPDKFHCNYGNMIFMCEKKCPKGMATLSSFGVNNAVPFADVNVPIQQRRKNGEEAFVDEEVLAPLVSERAELVERAEAACLTLAGWLLELVVDDLRARKAEDPSALRAERRRAMAAPAMGGTEGGSPRKLRTKAQRIHWLVASWEEDDRDVLMADAARRLARLEEPRGVGVAAPGPVPPTLAAQEQ